MKHIFILPYYCEQEVETYLEIADIWQELTETKIPYSFLLSSRFDCPPSKRLEERFSKIAKCEVFQCSTQGRGISKPDQGFDVEGPSSMFWDTLEYVNSRYEKDEGFAFWFESDMVPLKADWIEQLHGEWMNGEHLLMGIMIDLAWVTKQIPEKLKFFKRHQKWHINGGAAYSKHFASHVKRTDVNLRESWDFALAGHITGNKIPYKKTKLIEFFYKAKTLKQAIRKETILLHGVKDGSARKYVREKVMGHPDFKQRVIKFIFQKIRSLFRKHGQPIKLMIQGKKVISLDVPPCKKDMKSFFVFGLFKSGSSLLERLLRNVCFEAKIPTISLPQTLFAKDLYFEDISPSNPKIFQEQGYAYIGFRYILEPLFNKFDIKQHKKVFLIRDPRDALTSHYFSLKYSHVIPIVNGKPHERMVKQREGVMNQDIDDFVIEFSEKYIAWYGMYKKLIFDSNLKVYRYEDIIFNKVDFLKSMLDYFQIDLPKLKIKEIAERHDIFPTEENPREHIRQVSPGNYKKHLSEETICRLNHIFEDWLEEFNYI